MIQVTQVGLLCNGGEVGHKMTRQAPVRDRASPRARAKAFRLAVLERANIGRAIGLWARHFGDIAQDEGGVGLKQAQQRLLGIDFLHEALQVLIVGGGGAAHVLAISLRRADCVSRIAFKIGVAWRATSSSRTTIGQSGKFG